MILITEADSTDTGPAEAMWDEDAIQAAIRGAKMMGVCPTTLFQCPGSHSKYSDNVPTVRID